MYYQVTITELTPTENLPKGEVFSRTVEVSEFSDAIEVLNNVYINFTYIINASITLMKE